MNVKGEGKEVEMEMEKEKENESMARLTREVMAEGKTITEGLMIPPEELIFGDNSRRYDPEQEVDDELMLSILSDGQIGDVLVRLNDQRQPVVVAGEQRVRAILKANTSGLADPPLKVRCTVRDLDEAAAFTLSIAENERRYKPSPADQAYAVKRLVDGLGKTQEEAGKVFGKSQTWVSEMLTIAGLPSAILKRVHSGEIAAVSALALAGLDKPTRKVVVARLDEEGVKITADAIEQVVEELSQVDEASEEEQAASAKYGKVEVVAESYTNSGEAAAESDAYHHVSAGEEVEATPDGSEPVIAEPTPPVKKKRGRPKKTHAEKVATKSKKALSLKAVHAFFVAQSQPAEGEDQDVYQELCAAIVEWMDHKIADRTLAARMKTACGLDG